MKIVYELTHKNLIECDVNTGEEICDIKLLGFFSSKEACDKAIEFYIQQPGFLDYPHRFFVEEIEADINDFNDEAGEFDDCVYYLTHEWYDGEYDYVSYLGWYSTYDNAIAAEEKYKNQKEYLDLNGEFGIDKYIINEREWTEGFFTWKNDNSK